MAELPAEDCPRGPVCTEGQEFEVQFLRAGATSSQNRFLVRPFLMSVLEWRSPVAQDQPARRHRRQLQPATGPQLEAEMGGERRGDALAAEEAGVPLQPLSQALPFPRLRAPGTVLLLGVTVVVLVSILEIDVSVR